MRKVWLVGLCLATAACGNSMEQRSASGGLSGAGVGALVGGPIGAVVGAAAGSVGGAAMPEGADQLAQQGLQQEHKLVGAPSQGGSGSSSPPAASGTSSRVVPANAMVSRDTVMQAQSELKKAGFYKGRVDGVAGRQTRVALSQYQKKQGLPQTSRLDEATLQNMNLASFSAGGAGSLSGKAGTSPETNPVAGGPNANPPAGVAGAGPMMTSDQVRSRLQADGYDNVSNIRRNQTNGFTARAMQNSMSYSVNVDGHTGQIVSRRQITGATQGSGSSLGVTRPAQPDPNAVQTTQ